MADFASKLELENDAGTDFLSGDTRVLPGRWTAME